MSIIIKRCKMWGIKYKDFNCFLECTIFRDNLIEYKCLCCNKNYYKILFNTHKFSNHDINRFIVLLWKVVYLYESLHEKPYFRFSNDLKRWSFQKNRTGIWSVLYHQERWYFFSPKIWSFSLDGKWKMNFSKNTWKYDIFFKYFEKTVFPKKITLEYDFTCIIRKDGISFLEYMIIFL